MAQLMRRPTPVGYMANTISGSPFSEPATDCLRQWIDAHLTYSVQLNKNNRHLSRLMNVVDTAFSGGYNDSQIVPVLTSGACGSAEGLTLLISTHHAEDEYED